MLSLAAPPRGLALQSAAVYMKGRKMVYFIGAGPGDPELLTIKGKSLICQADIIIYAGSMVNPAVLDGAREDAEIYDSSSLHLGEIVDIMREGEARGKMTARVHTGDPSIYGALREQMDALDRLAIPYEVVPGVSSFLAAAAALKKEYTLPGVSQTLILTRVEGRTPMPEKEKLRSLAAHQAAMVVFLGVGQIEALAGELTAGGYASETPAAVVCKASWKDQKIVTGNLADIAKKVQAAGIRRTALVLVGDFLGEKCGLSRLYDRNFTHGFRKGPDNPRNQDGIGERELLAVSFGTSFNENRSITIGAIEADLEAAFPDFSVRRAFSSNMVISHILRRDGVRIDNIGEAVRRAKENGVKTLAVQPTHLMGGFEYQKVVEEISRYAAAFEQISFGKPLLYDDRDFKQVERAVADWTAAYDDGETAICLMGHGTEADSNFIYQKMQDLLAADGYGNYFIGTVDAAPTLEAVLARIKKGNYKRVVLEPLMLVAGDHANNDMAGAGKNSWKYAFEREGYQVEAILRGLGENERIRRLYVEHARAAIALLR